MALRVVFKNHYPVGNWWRATCPWSGHKFVVHHSWEQLLKEVRQHLIERNYPIPLDFEGLVESWVCHEAPDQCYDDKDDFTRLPLRPHSLQYDDVLRGAKVWASFQLAGKPLVSEKEAQRRTDICSNCPLNVNFTGQGCFGCSSLETLVQSMIGNRRTTGSLFACQICHCWLQAAVWLPLDIQRHGVTDEMIKMFKTMKAEAGCWKQFD